MGMRLSCGVQDDVDSIAGHAVPSILQISLFTAFAWTENYKMTYDSSQNVVNVYLSLRNVRCIYVGPGVDGIWRK